MEELFGEIIQIYKTKVRIKQLKRKSLENFSRFFVAFIDSNKDKKDKKDKYLKLKKFGLTYISQNQDLIYSEINK
jgi:hypothetical protein